MDPLNSSSSLARESYQNAGFSQSNRPTSQSGQEVRNISPLAPRSPLPGQERGYRPQPLPPPPSHSHWGNGSAPATPPQQQNSWNAGRPHGSPTAPPPPPHARAGPGAAQGSMQARDPRAGFDGQQRRLREGDEDDRPLGQGQQQQQKPTGPPADPYVRIRITGLEKNRRDICLKFNAEVSA